MKTYIYFRNDDVNSLDKQLTDVTDIFLEEGVPIIHAVEPANVTEDTVNWLIDVKINNPSLVEIMQHGFDHEIRDKGEFGGKRSFNEQCVDLSTGKKIMIEKFGKNFLNAVNFPQGFYNNSTIKAINLLDYQITSFYFKHKLSRRIFYRTGQILKKGRMFNKHISHHMKYYPRTKIFEIDVCISFINKYIGGHSSDQCVFNSIEHITSEYVEFKKHTNVIGFLIHHRYHNDSSSLSLLREAIRYLKKDNNAVFVNYSELYKKFCGSLT